MSPSLNMYFPLAVSVIAFLHKYTSILAHFFIYYKNRKQSSQFINRIGGILLIMWALFRAIM